MKRIFLDYSEHTYGSKIPGQSTLINIYWTNSVVIIESGGNLNLKYPIFSNVAFLLSQNVQHHTLGPQRSTDNVILFSI